MAGYVARKFLTRNKCENCHSLLLQNSHVSSRVSKFTEICDRGGLLYPSKLLFEAVKKFEGIFTTSFSREELCSDSIVDVMILVKAKFGYAIGCKLHADDFTSAVVCFYVLTRLHFYYIKGLNQSREARRNRKLHLKVSRCS